MIRTFHSFASDESGMTAIETAVAVAIGAAIVFAFANALGDSFSASMTEVADKLQCATENVCARIRD